MTRDEAALLRLLQRHPEGLTLGDVMEALDGTHYATSSALRSLKQAGEAVSCIGVGQKTLWVSTDDSLALEARIRAQRKASAAAARQRTSQRHLTPEERAAEEAAAAEFVRRPMCRAVVKQACWAGQVSAPGPTSVFDLARTAA